jgi:HD-GYP domain-containing protein (c-di-GMP phosphodiesterase class II)
VCDLRHEGDDAVAKRPVSDLVDEITVALTNARIYERTHPRARASIGSLRACLATLARQGERDPVVLGTTEGLLIHDGKALLRASLSSARLIQAMRACRAGALSIGSGADERELSALVELLGGLRPGQSGVDDVNRHLAGQGVCAIRFLPEYAPGQALRLREVVRAAGVADAEGAPLATTALEVPVSLYQETVTVLQDSTIRVCHGEDIDLDGVRGYVEAILSRLTREPAAMMGLARYERYDAYTFGHSIRVCFLALNFARALVDDERTLLRIGLASLLHDIGKVRVPFEVLHSTKALSSDEREEMNKHTTHGAEILLGLPKVELLAVATAFGHHQTLDGGGYPATRHRVRPSIATQIVKICDVYEALTAVRPYKARMSPVRAYRVMAAMRDHFDPRLLRRFVAVNGVYPTGSVVTLDSGDLARVEWQTADPLAPALRLDGTAPGGGLVQDLSALPAAERPRVVAFADTGP